MFFDYHIHTTLSDGKHSHREMVERAIELGIQEIGFTDHFCIKQPCSWAVGEDGLQQMDRIINALKDEYSDRINILHGVECDYIEGREKDIEEALAPYDFDYIIGSVHFLGEWNYDTDRTHYKQYTNDHLYNWYFRILEKAIRSNLFTYMAHPDLIKKFKVWPDSPLQEHYKNIASTLEECNVGIEINTSGKDRPCGEFFPTDEFLHHVALAGGKVTFGSDSHKMDHLGRYNQEAKEVLLKAGFKTWTRYSKRVATAEKI